MRSFHKALTAALAFVASGVLASPIVATPGGAEAIVITDDNTVNATQHYKLPIQIAAATTPTAGQLNLSFVNNLASDNVNAYITGLNNAGQLVMLYPNGSWYYPTADNSGVPQPITADVAIPLGPQGSAIQISLPGYLTAGRIWFADGDLQFFTVMGGGVPQLVEPSAVNPSDPSAAVNWGFVELTWTPDGGIYANISYVDFVGLPVGMYLNATDGNQSALGVNRDAVAEICADLAAQTAIDGQPWDSLCVTDSKGTPLRVLSPTQYLSINNSAWSTYWNNYIDQVWDHYTDNNLTINTQAQAGMVNCSVTNETMYCAGDNRGYAKPTATDLYGCNGGPFSIQGGDNQVHYAVVPRLCAAFHRTTLLLPGGNVQPALNSSYFYTESPTNFYSKIVHEYEVDGKGYAFAYDDVTPDGAINDSGLLSDPNPLLLAITVGGPVADPPSVTTSTVSSSMVSTTMSQSSSTIKSSSSSTISTSQSSSGKTTSTSSSATLSTSSLLSNTSKPAVGTTVKTTSSSTSSSLTQTKSSSFSSSSSSQLEVSSTTITSSSSTKITSVKSSSSSTSVKSSASSSSSASSANELVTETVTQTTQAVTTTTALTTLTMSPVLSTSTTSSSVQSTTSKKPKKKRPAKKATKKSAVAKTTTSTTAVTTSSVTTSATHGDLAASKKKKPTRRITVTQKATITHTPTAATTTPKPSAKKTKKAGAKKGKKHPAKKTTTTTQDPAVTAPAMTTLKKVVSMPAPASSTTQEATYQTPTSLHTPFATKAIQVLKLFADGTWAWGR